MTQESFDPAQTPSARGWSRRILSASLFGILFFTLFPYWADFNQRHSPGRSLFLLSRPLGFGGFLHTFLNVLLFVPLGFALSQFFDRREKSWLQSISLALFAGAALSYAIEILQLYMPSRDSAWDDVLANALGTLAGTILRIAVGKFVFQKLSELEIRTRQILSFRKIFVTALIYFAVWFAISIPLQQKTHLNNWDPNSFMFVGYDAKNDWRWSGAVSRIQLWDHALADDRAIAITANPDFIDTADTFPLASYDLSQPPPVPSKIGLLPNLVLASIPFLRAVAHRDHRAERPPALMSNGSVPSLPPGVRRSNQFAVFIHCVPGRDNDTDGAIFAISTLSGKSDFDLRQEDSSVIIFIRTGLESSRQPVLAWRVPRVFFANVSRSILFSYDGAQGFLYIDGQKISKSYYLSPGAGLVGKLIRTKTDELVAYSSFYKSLIFLPVGFFLGLGVRRVSRRNSIYKLGVAAVLVVPPILLEALLVEVSGRRPSILQLGSSIGLTLAGMLWMNLDPPSSQSLV